MIVLNLAACIPVLLCVFVFSLYHYWTLWSNTTTIESWEKDKVATLIRRGKIRDIKYPYVRLLSSSHLFSPSYSVADSYGFDSASTHPCRASPPSATSAPSSATRPSSGAGPRKRCPGMGCALQSSRGAVSGSNSLANAPAREEAGMGLEVVRAGVNVDERVVVEQRRKCDRNSPSEDEDMTRSRAGPRTRR